MKLCSYFYLSYMKNCDIICIEKRGDIMVSFVHTGDIHLGLQFNKVSFNRELSLERRSELWTTFEKIVKYTKDNNKDFLFIAGDLFEEKYFTLGDMKRVRDILQQAENVNILISAGNHDFVGHRSLYNRVDWSPNVHIFKNKGIEKKEFPNLNTVVYGYSWDKVEIRENVLFNRFDFQEDHLKKVLLIHGDIGTNSNYLPLDLNTLKGLNMDYIALGHIHKPEIINNNIAYCGCPEPLDFGETGDRGFIEGNISKKGTSIDFIPFSKRKFLELDLSINENMGYLDIVNLFKSIEYGNKELDFYRIKLKGYIQNDLDIEGLVKSVNDDFYYLEIIDNTIPDYDLDALERTFEDSIIGQFIKEMKSKDLKDPIVKDALYYGLEALLKGRIDS